MAYPATKTKPAPRKPQRPGRFTAFTRTMWLLFGGGVLGFVLYVLAVSVNFLGLFGRMPNLKTLENPKSELASEIYSADGALMGKYFHENRTPAEYEDLPQHLVDALIATEDSRFEQHSGIDPKATGRVAAGLLTGGSGGGGSTLTQQLAKVLFRTRGDLNDGTLNDVPGVRMLITKTKEWILAVRLERNYTKREILRMYLNTNDYGSNAFGINTASKTFFNKKPKDLTVAEAATLVGVLNAPSRFSPRFNPERSKLRRNWVLLQMNKYGYLNETALRAETLKPIKLDYSVENQNEGIAPYFRVEVSKMLKEWARDTDHDLYADGLKIYTTIDSRMQRYAESAIADHMKLQQKWFDAHWKGQQPWRDENGKVIPNFINTSIRRTERFKSLSNRFDGNKDSINYYLRKKYKMMVFSWKGEKEVFMSPLDSLAYYKHLLQAGFMAMNPLNGQIKAWVGGTNYKYFKYDHVKQGKRQPGSTFKPIVYTAAIDQGYSPCYQRPDVATTFPAVAGRESYTPKNFEGGFSGRTFTLRQALARSMNSITAWVVQKIGPETVVSYAKRLGITSPIEAVPAVGFGSSDVSMYELCGAYGTFVNKGVWTAPMMVTRIEDKNGNVLREFVPQTREALSEETAYIMTHMLQASTTEPGGTSVILKTGFKFPYEIGAKTGTTSNYSDAWFMGITPDLVCGMWVGGEDRSIHFRTGAYGQGARLALPIYGVFMRKVYADKSIGISTAPFPKPAQPLSIEIDCSRYYGGQRDTIPYDQKLNQTDLEDLNDQDI
ncbi:penicillin-binding protein 1A [Hymenobacter daecheongensis DSM 21074]|uniref:Penicillin-binding protein 1A n=1 Tax=Hymenobacter daecheongensis DSM 21074 TaxID=1121955 RepID=A0A1M6ABM8_9BACT|nr:transglycosylase domain-containing protein [Hymenobacter daecheongensis]SHI33821.1 penicillin-binding protein 1A [Hymenobacter daecheongensis DSM 21074]